METLSTDWKDKEISEVLVFVLMQLGKKQRHPGDIVSVVKSQPGFNFWVSFFSLCLFLLINMQWYALMKHITVQCTGRWFPDSHLHPLSSNIWKGEN